jgi:hypothetical protein
VRKVVRVIDVTPVHAESVPGPSRWVLDGLTGQRVAIIDEAREMTPEDWDRVLSWTRERCKPGKS